MRKTFILIVLSLALLASCSKDDDNGEVVIIIGHSSGALLFSNLPAPKIVDKDFPNVTRTALDLDGDGDGELTILSSEELIGSDTLFKMLKLEKHPDADTNVMISLLPDHTVKNFQDGEGVPFPRDDVFSLRDEYLLAWNKHIISTGDDFIAGTWNALLEHCFVVEFIKDDKNVASWVMLSVTDYDNYILHDFASFSVPGGD